MNEKFYFKMGKTFYPKADGVKVSDVEVIGNYWRAWLEDDKCFYEFDIGHFSSKFKQVEISKEDFDLLKNREVSNKYLKEKYLNN